MAVTESLLQIGDVAARVGLSLRTVRYYEEIGLVVPSARTTGGFRLYSKTDVERLETVKQMKPLGLSLEEMAELLELLERSEQPSRLARRKVAETTERLEGYAERADERIERLERDLVQARALRLRMSETLGRCSQILDTPMARA